MDYVYLMVDDEEWEDMTIYLSEEEAIQASIKYPNFRIEIFSKNDLFNGYRPTYNYYKKGILHTFVKKIYKIK